MDADRVLQQRHRVPAHRRKVAKGKLTQSTVCQLVCMDPKQKCVFLARHHGCPG